MITLDSIALLDPDMQAVVKSSIRSIANSGVIKIQQDTNFASILSGAAEEPADILAKRILEHRKNQYALDSLLDLANQIRETE